MLSAESSERETSRARIRRRIWVAALVVATVALAAAAAAQGTWRTAAPLPSSRTEVTGAELDDRIYVIGGFGGGGEVVEAYDPKTDRWERRAPLPAPVHHAAAVALGGSLYVVGGYSGLVWSVLDTVFEYSPSTDRWRERAKLPTPRGALAAAALDGRIYAVGGVGRDSRNTGALEVFDVAANRWEARAPMPTPRDHLAAAALDGKLYAVGGRRNGDYRVNLDAHEAYDPARNAWSSRAALPTARSGIAAAVLGRRIFVFGGEGPGGTFPQVEAYEPDSDASPRPGRSGPRGSDLRDLGGPATRRVLQLGERGVHPLTGGTDEHRIASSSVVADPRRTRSTPAIVGEPLRPSAARSSAPPPRTDSSAMVMTSHGL